jgi:hypothetical protein
MSERHTKTRIGTLGYPGEVWEVFTLGSGQPLTVVGFYDRDKAVAYAEAGENRHLKSRPLKIMDA